MSFVQIVRLAFPDVKDSRRYTVSYHYREKGGAKYSEGGVVSFNEKIPIKTGMVFNVALSYNN